MTVPLRRALLDIDASAASMQPARMSSDDFRLCLATRDEAHVIHNLWPLYLHDISAHDGRAPNRHGVIGDDDSTRVWGSPGDWWSQPRFLFPYLIRVGEAAAGFNLISSGPFVSSAGIDYTVHEFFVAKAFRGTEVALRAAREGIARHRGSWEVVTYPGAARPIAFWRKALGPCAGGEVVETDESNHALGHKIVFRFSNQERA